jgi:hypothetical protein
MANTSGRRTGQGRRSPEARAVIARGPGAQRPEPPDEFAEPERAVWHRIVDACPVDWFGAECLPLLARLCMLLVMAEQLELKLRSENYRFKDKEDARAYIDFNKTIANITTKLRLTPQSRFNRFEASTRMKNRVTYRPWDDGADEAEGGPNLRVVDGDE